MLQQVDAASGVVAVEEVVVAAAAMMEEGKLAGKFYFLIQFHFNVEYCIIQDHRDHLEDQWAESCIYQTSQFQADVLEAVVAAKHSVY